MIRNYKNPRRRQFQKNAPWSDRRSRSSLESAVLPPTPLVLSAPATTGDRRPRISTTRSPQSAATEPWLAGNLCLIRLIAPFLFVLALLHSVDRDFFPCGARVRVLISEAFPNRWVSKIPWWFHRSPALALAFLIWYPAIHDECRNAWWYYGV